MRPVAWLRRTVPLAVSLTVVLGCADALAARTTLTVRGDVAALALAGDAVIVARQRADRSLRLERLSPGAPAQTLLRLPRARRDQYVWLAASPQALAVSVGNEVDENTAASRVFAGRSTGPLREVAACADAFGVPPVSVFGSRVAWSDGACADGSKDPLVYSPVAFVVGDADPAVPPRRVPVGFEALAVAIVLTGDTGLVGVARPAFFSFVRGETRRLGLTSLGAPIAKQDGGIVTPVGVLSSGRVVLSRQRFEDDDSERRAGGCTVSLLVAASGGGQEQPLSFDGCPPGDESSFPGLATQTAGDRVITLLQEQDAEEGDGSPRSLTSVRGDGDGGGGARVIARGRYRHPRGLAADASGRVAWWQPHCAGGAEIVIDDGAAGQPATISSCRLRLLNHSAHVSAGHITLRLRCPSGCSGRVRTASRTRRVVRSFAFERGTHRLRVRLTRRERRSGRLRLRFEVEAGASPLAGIRLR